MNRNDSEWLEYGRLMSLAQGGDTDAYARLLSEISSVVTNFVRSRLRNSSWHQDVSQEILMAIHTGRHTFRPDCAFRPWLYAIMRNKIIDFLRSRSRRIEEQLYLPLDHVTEGDSVELRCDLQRVYGRLSEKEQQLFTFAKRDGLSNDEIAGMTKTSVGAAKVAIHRLMVNIRAKLAAE
ncbi:MAG: sigma-70 family RNA polymerase sigma factor [Bdellovibrionota bacterium]